MAEVLESFEFTRGVRGRYPWDKWLDGQPWRIDAADFAPVTARSFAMNACQYCNRRGIKVRTQMVGDSVVIQAFPKETT